MIGTSQLINTFSRPCFTDTTDIFKDGSGVALYGLDYDASDAGGASGKFGEAAIFNGSSSKITSTGFNITGNRSVSLWVKMASSSSQATGILSTWNNGADYLEGFVVRGGVNNTNFVLSVDTTNHTIAALNTNWNHIAVIYDGTYYQVYFNGTQVLTNIAVQSGIEQLSNLQLGARHTPTDTQYFSGSIDQVRIFNTALTSSQVTQLYQENNSTVGTHLFGCIANYNLDGNAKESMGTTAYDGTETDITYRYDGTPTAVDFGVGGKSNYGARFNGNTSIINTNYVLPADSTMSFSFWAKFDAVDNGSERDFFGNVAVNGSGSNVDNRLVFRLRNDNNFSINIGNGSNYWSNNTVANATPYYNQWTFLCVTLNGTSVKVYINNSTVSLTSSVAFGTAGVLPLFIGEWGQGFGSKRYKGSIDQFRIFNKELSASEVSKLYGNGAGEIACAYTSTTDNVAYPIVNTAYYKLDNNSKDSARSTGKFNEGAIFNGSSSYIDLPLTSLFGGKNTLSVSLWFKTTTTSSQRIFTDYAQTSRNCDIRIDGGNLIIVTDYAATSDTYTTTLTYNDDNWHNLVVAISATQRTIYIDNSLLDTITLPSGSWDGYGQRVTLGAFYSSTSGYSGYFNGKIDQVRIYNTALSSTDVSNLYAETVSNTSTLAFPSGKTAIATYQLDGNSTDLSGNYNGTDTDVAYAYDGTETDIEYRFGRYGQAAVFNGSSSYINLPNLGTDMSGSNTRTLSAWVNLDASPSVYSAVVSYGGAASLQSFGLYISSTGTPRVSYYNINYDTSTTLTLGNWHHIVGIYKGGNVETTANTELYIDGQIQTLTATNGLNLTGSINTSNTNYAIGYYRATPSGSYFNGSIDQVRIYSTALSSSQVTQLYNEKPEVDTSNFKAVVYEGNGGTQYISNVGMDLETDGGLVWVKNRDFAVNHYLYDSIRGTGAAKALHSNTTDSETSASTYSVNGGVESFDANGFFAFEGSDSTYQGTNKSGQDYVAWVWKAGGLLNKSASFNGSSSRIATGLTLPADSTMSFSFWLKSASNSSGNNYFLSDFDSIASDNSSRLSIAITANNGLRIWISDGSSNWNSTDDIDLSSYVNLWMNLVVVINGTDVKVYINGGTPTTLTSSVAFGTAGSRQQHIGRAGDLNGAYYEGSIDQVRIFNKAISSSEVTSLYNETASTINTLQVLGDTSCIAAYPLGTGAGDIGNTYPGTPTNVTFNNPGHLTRNTNGTIESAVSANTAAGFSIVKYDGYQSSGTTCGHGLSSAPELIIAKNLNQTTSWPVWYDDAITTTSTTFTLEGSTKYLALNSTTGYIPYTFDRQFGGTLNGGSGDKMIAYCFHSVVGYSKIGSYTGTGVSGQAITGLGFAPSFVMIKNASDVGSWIIHDKARNPNNPSTKHLRANTSSSEDTGANEQIDFDSDGFTLIGTGQNINHSDLDTYIYMAFK